MKENSSSRSKPIHELPFNIRTMTVQYIRETFFAASLIKYRKKDAIIISLRL